VVHHGYYSAHDRGGITAQYTHVADVVVVRAADEAARVTLALMAGKGRDDAVQAGAA
jgi:hypothetical protein